MRLIVTILLAGCCAAVSAGEVYKWVDKDGKVHYGDRPKHQAEQVIGAPPANDVEDPETVKAAEAKAAECNRKKAQLENYRKASSIKETDSLGRIREYSEEERQKLLNLTERQVTEACEPPAPGG
jgi:hypothetical protein